MLNITVTNNYTLFSPEEYVYYQLLKYPTLYAQSTYEQVALSVLNQLLNTIGNGISTNEELYEELTYKEFSIDDAKRLITTEQLYTGYYSVTKRHGITVGNGGSVDVLESDKGKHSTVKHWVKKTRHQFVPYPNFNKKYSVVYTADFKSVGKEWTDTAIWFYQQCAQFLNDTPELMNNACITTEQIETAVMNFNDRLTSVSILTNNTITEYISEYYEFPFDGDIDNDRDIEKFVVGRWNKYLQEMKQFIVDTITMLKDD